MLGLAHKAGRVEIGEEPVYLLDDVLGELDEERKAAMVSNLLVVLCADEAAQPVVNVADDQLPAVFLPQDSQKA